MAKRRPRIGSIYRRKTKRADGTVVELPTWWLKYYRDGQPFRESTGSDSYAEAERQLKARQGEIVSGRFAGLEPERVTIGELLELLIDDYKLREIRGLKQAQGRIEKHLVKQFASLRASRLNSHHIRAYIGKRHKEEAANATINRELELLRRALKLGYETEPKLVTNIPKMERLPERNVRMGTLDHDGFLRLRDILPPHYRLLLVFGYYTGARMGELLSIEWDQVKRGEVLLTPVTTKTEKPRRLPIYGEMQHWVDLAREEKHPKCSWLFQVAGERMVFNWRSWARYCKTAGLEGLLFHDLRRSALTNMVRAGVREKVAMDVSGHLTRKTFERYHIVTEESLREVGEKVQNYLAGTMEGTSEKPKTDKLLN